MKTPKRLALLLLLMNSAAASPAAASPAAASPAVTEVAAGRTVLRHPDGRPRLVTGLSITVPGKDLREKAERFVELQGAALGLGARSVRVDAVEGRSVRMEQVHDGLPVQGAALILRFDAEGPSARLVNVNNETRSVKRTRPAKIDEAQALALAGRAVLGPSGKPSPKLPVKRLWLPLSAAGGEVIEVFEVLVATVPGTPPERVLVDGERGEVIGRKSAGAH
jgi:hypothetical protein